MVWKEKIMIKVTILGTAATMPLPERALTAAVLNCNGHTILFDCGEGTQSAARKAGVSLMKCEIIALTHFHGDHIFGLPGLLQTMSCLGRQSKLTIIGPKGIEEALRPIMELSGELTYEVSIQEMREPIHIFPEATLSCFKTKHRCQSIGYSFTLDRPGIFQVDKATELGVDKEDWGKLQHGISVGKVSPEMVLGEKRKGLKVVFSGDTMPCDELEKAAEDADLFICEATYAEDEHTEQAENYGHMTFSQACRTGRKAARTVLVHFSQMIEDPEIYELSGNAEVGTDGMQIILDFEQR